MQETAALFMVDKGGVMSQNELYAYTGMSYLGNLYLYAYTGILICQTKVHYKCMHTQLY